MSTIADQLWSAGLAARESSGAGRATTRRLARDLFVVALAGHTAPATKRAIDSARRSQESGASRVWGTELTLGPASAAFVNAVAAQSLDFDDIAPAATAHLGSVLVPTLAALEPFCDSRELLDSYTVGLSIAGALAPVFGLPAYMRGFQTTCLVGGLAGAAAAACALNLDHGQFANAVGLFATSMLGLRAHTGTDNKAGQTGWVSAAAVRSAHLASSGFTSNAAALNEMFSLFGVEDPQSIDISPDPSPTPMATKLYPACGAGHPAIEAAIELRGFHNGDAPGRMQVHVSPAAVNSMPFESPRNDNEARFSLKYCVAVARVSGTLNLSDFASEAILRPAVGAVMERITIVADPDASLSPSPSWSVYPARVVEESDGGVLGESRVDEAMGFPAAPATKEQLLAKFTQCIRDRTDDETARIYFEELDRDDIFTTVNSVNRL